MVRYRLLEICRTGGGFEARPQGWVRIDLQRAKRALEKEGFELVADVGILLLFRSEGVEFSLFESGKILYKTQERSRAESLHPHVLRALEGIEVGRPGPQG